MFKRAAETGVAIELDGDVSRQDLDYRVATAAKKAGCVFALDSDAHAANQLWMADYAIAHARLAGIPANPHHQLLACGRYIELGKNFSQVGGV